MRVKEVWNCIFENCNTKYLFTIESTKFIFGKEKDPAL